IYVNRDGSSGISKHDARTALSTLHNPSNRVTFGENSDLATLTWRGPSDITNTPKGIKSVSR
ncbi:hypothetical protein, partial [Bartonella sp. CL45QHWL]|uniref:hypothetical protein n=1 Tax=Bartonella sp. CL45QHWL TaxID=3243533 RepID=UPI0035D01F68